MLYETKIGRAKDGSWGFAVHVFVTGQCVASEAGFGSRVAAQEAALDAKAALK